MLGTPNYPLLMASGMVVIVAALIGSAAMSGALPALAAKHRAAAMSAAKTCGNCGVVTVIRKRTHYDVTVEMDDGRLITIAQPEAPTFGPGERVRVNGDFLFPVRG